MGRLAHFDITVQHIAGSNLKFTNFLIRNPVDNATSEDVYDEQHVTTILSTSRIEQSQNATEGTKTTETNFNDQSKRYRTFEKNRDVNKNSEKAELEINNRRQKAKTENSIQNSDQNSTSNRNPSQSLPFFKTEMDQDYFHWGATAEIMEIIRRRRKNPETLRLVERLLEISRPGTMRRKFDMNAQRQIWVPSRPNKRSRQEIAEIDGELLTRANRFGGGYQTLEDTIEDE